ncbi:DHS-like NAD/FAD-binding domain-containing protein [Rhodotorula diobovata]|uniref:DHS-like NAD/FAD-binding domain-containing protein n=1 Tax=Rhodotorula diobovata TaxID=5288 RepID=A0A5C5G5A5_9BASI|nr:DHS-like NAD/FAD-binding domain-containing protein [Rhodotorula diobovata]
MQRLVLDVQEDSASSTTLEGLAHVGVSLASSRRAIVGLGAGCSTSAGIPDFRSPRASSSAPSPTSPAPSSASSHDAPRLSVQATKQLFSYSALLQPDSRANHLRFMAQLRRAVRRSRPRTLLPSKKGKERAVDAPTEFHALLAELDERGQLQRVYTQNIDGLERRAGLAVVDLAQMAAEEAQAESSGSDYERAKPSRRMRTRPGETDGRQMEAGEGVVVPLHGGLEEVMCGACGWREKWRKRHTKAFKKGETVECTRCSARVTSRRMRSKRLTTVSPLAFLRPAVLLYDDPHSSSSSAASLIASLAAKDLAHEPDLLLVAGTSLRIPGFAKLVKRFAGRVGRNGGLRVLVNRDGVGKEWEGVFDYHVVGDTNWFAAHMVDWLDVLSAAEASEHTATTAKTETSPGRTLFAPLPARPAYGLHSPAPSSSSVVTRLSLPTTPPRSSPFPLPASASPPPPALAKRARPAPVESVVEDERSPPPLPTPPSSALLAPVALPLPEPTHGVRRVSSTPRAATPRPPKRRRLSNPPGAAAPLAPLPPRMSAAELLARAAARAAREKLERKRAKRERRAKREERRRRREEVPEAGLGEA